MAGRLTNMAVRGVSKSIPGLRQVPVARLLLAAEMVLLAREHLRKLDPYERRRIVQLVRAGRGRPGRLTQDERDELAILVAKAEPRLFVGLTASMLSPVPLPRRVVRGPLRRRR